MDDVFYIYNGIIKRTAEPFVTIKNRAISYGDGFFESILAYNENIPLLSKHILRIEKAFRALSLNRINLLLNYNELKHSILFLAHKNKIYKTYKIKITVFRDSKGLYRPESNDASYIIETVKLENDYFHLNTVGLKIDIYHNIHKSYSSISAFKTLNALPSVLGQLYASQNNLDDVLFTDINNNIVESTNANIFALYNNVLITPPISSGCVEGIMRNVIINEVSEHLNLKVKELDLTEQILINSSELILTNSIIGVKYVLAFKQRRYFNVLSIQINSFLNNFFFKN